MKNDENILKHIIECCQTIERLKVRFGNSFEDFNNDELINYQHPWLLLI